MNKLDDRRKTHLLNFVFKRAQDEEYCQVGLRELRRFDSPILNEIKANNTNFERSILFQGAQHWNSLDVETKSIASINVFKKRQKCKLNSFFPY